MIEATTMMTTLASVYMNGVEEGAVCRYDYSVVEEEAIPTGKFLRSTAKRACGYGTATQASQVCCLFLANPTRLAADNHCLSGPYYYGLFIHSKQERKIASFLWYLNPVARKQLRRVQSLL